MTSILIDITIIVGLIITFIQTRLQNKKINMLKNILIELGPVINEFSKAVEKSETNIDRLKSTAEKTINNINISSVTERKEPDIMNNKNKITNDLSKNIKYTTNNKDELIDQFFKLTKRN